MSEDAENPKREDTPPPPAPRQESENKELKGALQKMGEGRPQILQEIMAMGFSSSGNPLLQKMTDQHVTQVLNLVTSHDERQFSLTQSEASSNAKHRTLTAWFAFVGTLVFCALLIFIIMTFKDKPDVLTPILTGLGGLVGGGLGGFGIGRHKSSE